MERRHYQGYAVIFWTLTLENRAQGWLGLVFHTCFRDQMLHAAGRYGLLCPVYCLMPDHLHLIWMGLRSGSDQRNAMKFLRIHLEAALGGGAWLHQAHDHVLRENERRRKAFALVCLRSGEFRPCRAGGG